MKWLKKLSFRKYTVDEVLSNLFDERTFYKQFIKDLLSAKEEVIIESPYITIKRLKMLMPTFEKLKRSNVKIFILTKSPDEHDVYMDEQAEIGIRYFENNGIQVLIVNGGHHRKLAMIDRKIMWEGSLNILSQSYSKEFMRRINSRKLTEELFRFLRFDKISLFRD